VTTPTVADVVQSMMPYMSEGHRRKAVAAVRNRRFDLATDFYITAMAAYHAMGDERMYRKMRLCGMAALCMNDKHPSGLLGRVKPRPMRMRTPT